MNDDKMEVKCEMWRSEGKWMVRIYTPRWVLDEMGRHLDLTATHGGDHCGWSATYIDTYAPSDKVKS